ncbi:MAG: hypothetical protein II413_13100 [Treponema sp.]|nr:hypothetical protein [Treponema sp.]
MDPKRPRGREKNVTEGGSGVHKRGDGLGTGPVGSSNGYNGHSNSSGGNSSGGYGGSSGHSGGPSRGVKLGGGGLVAIIIFLVVQFLGKGSGGGILSSLLGGGSSSQGSAGSSILGSLLGGDTSAPSGFSGASSGNSVQTSYNNYDKTVAPGSREKYTKIAGNGNDDVTIMVFMCGTDLESRNGMASNDLAEMAASNLGKINLIVYTGGCKSWRTKGISNSKNQIYQVTNGSIKLLAEESSKKMIDPSTLSSFIKWTAGKFPANRYELIFWDHGGGSVSGYGYDEKYPSAGSMTLAGINKALNDGGVKFDFVGFDACLMATAETALMMNRHADYMIASEETEPGIGWYYTNWLNDFGRNTSLSTLDIGKKIVDDFVATCANQCRGQKTTLSVIDLAEFSNTVPEKLSSFSKSITSKIKQNEYKEVSDARYQTREFATSSKIDQVDFIDLCKNVDNSEANALAKALKGAIKYNKTSSNMTNAYGVSIYFPYARASYVDKMCDTYDDIGMDSSYAQCIKEFANLEVSGQVAAGGTSSAAGSLFDFLGGMTGGAPASGSDAIGDLLTSFITGGGSASGGGLGGGLGDILISGLTGRNIGFMEDSQLSAKQAGEYIAANRFNAGALDWKKDGQNRDVLSLTESQWSLVHGLDLNMFYDDGEGYVDLGLDNVYDFSEDGSLIASSDRTWLSINSQPVAYYHLDTTELGGDKYTITGRVPAMLNGQRVNLILVFDDEHPHGYVAGARTDYREDDAHAQAKNITLISEGDKIDFLCDYYSYQGEYKDSYYLGNQLTVGAGGADSLSISNTNVGSGKVKVTYRFTDIYNQQYWTPAIVY